MRLFLKLKGGVVGNENLICAIVIIFVTSCIGWDAIVAHKSLVVKTAISYATVTVIALIPLSWALYGIYLIIY